LNTGTTMSMSIVLGSGDGIVLRSASAVTTSS
jgi:hypothetical protein